MSETDTELGARLDAVERALTDDGTDLADVRDAAALSTAVDDLENRVAELEATVEELDAAVQAVRGYAGNVRAVNREVERRASAALAKAEALESSVDDRLPRTQHRQAVEVSAERDAERTRPRGSDDEKPAGAALDRGRSRARAVDADGRDATERRSDPKADRHDDRRGECLNERGRECPGARPRESREERSFEPREERPRKSREKRPYESREKRPREPVDDRPEGSAGVRGRDATDDRSHRAVRGRDGPSDDGDGGDDGDDDAGTEQFIERVRDAL